MPDLPEPNTVVVTREGWRLGLRPVRPDDAAALVDMARRSTAEDLRFRFFSTIKPDLGPLVVALADFDHDRQIAAAAYDPQSPAADREILGVVRLTWGDGRRRAEFAIMVRSDLKGHGLGHVLIDEMLGWAVRLGIDRVDGEVMAENSHMLQMVRACGGVVEGRGGDFRTVRVAFDLGSRLAPAPGSLGAS